MTACPSGKRPDGAGRCGISAAGFGFLDSGREDVKYEDFKGHKLDRKMLELLLEFK